MRHSFSSKEWFRIVGTKGSYRMGWVKGRKGKQVELMVSLSNLVHLLFFFLPQLEQNIP